MPALDLRAAITRSSVDEENRTVEVVFTTGAAVRRFDWNSGSYYLEKLSLEPAHVRLERLNSGAPVLDTHSAYSLASQMGVVEDGTAALNGKRGTATLRFSKRAEVEPRWQDVKDRIVRNVSVGYQVHAYEEIPAKRAGGLPTRLATDWEPFEISMCPMQADLGAQTRGAEKPALYPCVITRRMENVMNGAGAATETTTRQDGLSETLDEQMPDRLRMEASDGQRAAADAHEEETPQQLGARQERERCSGILLACRAAKMPSTMYDKLVADGTSLVDAQRKIFEELQKRTDPNPNAGPNAQARRSVEMGDDPFIHKRAGIENALLHRVNPSHFKLEAVGREYRGMSMLDIAKTYLAGRGVRTTDMPRMELAGAALGLVQIRGGIGMHSTSDFPYLLADVANKSLRADYEAAPQTFEPIVRRGTVPDFKASNRVQIGDAPALKPVGEHGEFTRGSIEEGREQVQAATYGRVFAITRQALVNDDLDAFSRVPTKFGRAAKNLESDLVWYQILKNANMNDGNALFSAAHANYAGAGEIGVLAVGAGAQAMYIQRGLDGTTLVSAPPKYLIVPPSQLTLALQFVSTAVQPTTSSNVNPWAGKLEVIVEPRLQTGVTIGPNSATGSNFAWYLATDKNLVDIVELVFLEGQDGPVIESRVGFDIDGLEIKCRHDVGAKALDYRGIYKSDGSDNS